MNEWINVCSRNTKITSCLSFVLTDTEWWMKSRSKVVLNLVSRCKNPTEFHLVMFGSLLLFTSLLLTSVLIVFCVGKTCHRVFQCASAKMKNVFHGTGNLFNSVFSYIQCHLLVVTQTHKIQWIIWCWHFAQFYFTPWSFIRVNCWLFFFFLIPSCVCVEMHSQNSEFRKWVCLWYCMPTLTCAGRK
jgi:hypothetical protein